MDRHQQEPILVVDDDPVQHTLIKSYLRHRQVSHAHSTGEALEAGVNDFLLKPLDKKTLEGALENAQARISRWKSTLMELFHRKKEGLKKMAWD